MKKNEKGMMPQREQVKKSVEQRALSPEEQVLLVQKASPEELGILPPMSSEDVLAYVRSYKGRDAHLREELELIEKATPAQIIAACGVV